MVIESGLTNKILIDAAEHLIPGGVNSPVRAFRSVGGNPIFMQKAKGQHIWDVQNKKYLDFVGSWGPMIIGHSHDKVITAIKDAAEKGTSFGAATVGEIEMAEKIVETVGSVEMVRLVNSGTEATMSALRLARAFTRREKLIKFAGCYHGHSDSFLVQAGSGAMTLGVPDSPGVTRGAAGDTLIAQFNDISSVSRLILENKGEVAAVIIEPVVGNAGVIPPVGNFLSELREITEKEGVLLIFDEVMTGFRLAAGGAQERYDISPDLTTMGKVMGGGMPIGAFGGRREIMEMLAPAGPVYQAGTLSGNPLAVAAGLATLNELNSAVYDKLEGLAERLEAGIRKNLVDRSLPFQYQRVGSMACLFFTDKPVRNYNDAVGCDVEAFGKYYHCMLEAGVFLPPSQFEAFFLSTALTDADIDRATAANDEALGII